MAGKKQKSKNGDYEQLARVLSGIYESGYLNRRRLYTMSFVKGLVAGFGGVIGATIVVALLIWILSLFTEIRFIGPVIDPIRNTIEER